MSWIWDEEWGAWTRPVGDGTTAAELYPNDIADFPPLVEVQEERDRLLAIVKRLCGAAGDNGTNWWYPDCEYDPPHWDLMADTAYPTIQRTEPMDPEDAALIRLAVGIEQWQTGKIKTGSSPSSPASSTTTTPSNPTLTTESGAKSTNEHSHND